MHYKNGREAKEGDSVIGKAWVGKQRVVAGTIHSLNAGSQTCNGQVAVSIPGGVVQVCVTVGDFVHAEDAYPE